MGETTKAELEGEMIGLTNVFGGGGWGWDQGVMPYIKLTLPEARQLAERLPEEERAFKSVTEELHYHIVRAEQHARQAHDLLYKEDGPKRSLWYKTAIGRAQSILMTLWQRELRWKA
jgi:hypothetical protein